MQNVYISAGARIRVKLNKCAQRARARLRKRASELANSRGAKRTALRYMHFSSPHWPARASATLIRMAGGARRPLARAHANESARLTNRTFGQSSSGLRPRRAHQVGWAPQVLAPRARAQGRRRKLPAPYREVAVGRNEREGDGIL